MAQLTISGKVHPPHSWFRPVWRGHVAVADAAVERYARETFTESGEHVLLACFEGEDVIWMYRITVTVPTTPTVTVERI